MFKNKSGFTILEVLISIGIIIIGIFAVLTLTVSTMTTNDKALEYTIAANLAREGIELVRNRRDTNWYNEENFDLGLTDPDFPLTNLYTAIIDYNDAEFDFVPDTIDAVFCKLKRQFGVYSYDAGGEDTAFSRLIYLNDICLDLSADPIASGEVVKDSGDHCDAGYIKIGINVESKVKWTTKGQKTRTLIINNRIYDWR